jgi:hypothetical protein
MIVVRLHRGGASHLPFDQQPHIRSAGSVPAKAILIRVIEVLDAERLATAIVSPIEKRAVLTIGRHKRPRHGGGTADHRRKHR